MVKMKPVLTFAVAIFVILFSSCKKDKYTSAPQIKFNSIKPNVVAGGLGSSAEPILSIQLTDAEGDFGFSDKDTSYVYVKNITIPPFDIDSFPFPAATQIKRKDLNAEINVNLADGAGLIVGTPSPPTRPYTDTLYFEVYVRDFANHKSNVIKTKDPLYLITE